MGTRSAAPVNQKTASHAMSLAMQRRCSCGSHAAEGECEACLKPRRLALQAKQQINQPGDRYEQEADRIAHQLLAAPSHPGVEGSPIQVQRFAQTGQEPVTAVPTSVGRALAGSGRPLDPVLREDMEHRFGHDFTQVRIHEDPQAEQSAREVNARAYTVGQDIVFDARQFSPATPDGRLLIAHELTHVLQQTAGTVQSPRLQRWSWAEIKEKAYDGMIAGIRQGRDAMRNGLRKLATSCLPAHLHSIAESIIEAAVTVVDLLITVILAVLGIVVGFGEGIVGMVLGLFTLAKGVTTLLYDLIAGIFTNFDAAKQDLSAIWEAIKGLPEAIKKLVTDWVDKFGKASSERQTLMIGELTGQILAIIATYAVAAGRAGSAAKATATTAEVGSASGEVVTTVARAKPVLTVIEGGGGSGGISARAASFSGNAALKVAPELEPVLPPLRLVPPLRAPVITPTLPAAPSAIRAVAAGVGVGTTTITNLGTSTKPAPITAQKPKPKPPSCGGPTGLTPADPISLTWYKVREDDYYPKRIYLKDLVYGRDDPSNPRRLPLGEPIGVPNKYWPRIGKIMQLIPSFRGSKADDFRAVLSRYGYDWSGLQADHVQDLDWSGPDEFYNIWPLSSSANLSAGPRQNSHQRISYCETPEGPHIVNQTLTDFKATPGHYGRYFRIDRIER